MTNFRLLSSFIKSNSKARIFLFIGLILLAACSRAEKSAPVPFSNVRTISSDKEKFGEPFGIAYQEKNDVIYFSDGETGKIWKIQRLDRQSNFPDAFTLVTDKFDTPSAIAFDKTGDLIVADSGTHTIKKINIETGEIELVAGIENQKGFADGDAQAALFNAPIGIAASEDKIYVADTYNDKIRLIQNGKVTTIAGSEQGYADAESGFQAKFDTPCGLAIWKNNLIVADTGNHRLRMIEPKGKTWTLAGNNSKDSVDGFLSEASFVSPTALAVDDSGVIYVADGNAIRAIGRRILPFVETLTHTRRGFADGKLSAARFNRPSGLATGGNGNLYVADAGNQTIRFLTGAEVGTEISKEAVEKMRVSAEEFRRLGEPRWTYNPPDRRREIAGTLGEIRGEIVDENSQAWFHNGLDIAGGYGETARFVRTEKVLSPFAVENFATLRELLRMPTLGYIHIRLGRDQNDNPYDDRRFQFSRDEQGKLKSVRIPRGARFGAGEAIGTLNAMNHVHLIAGRPGAEMNALAALDFPGISDAIAPKITRVSLYNESWQPLPETKKSGERIKLDGKTRIIAAAYDRMDGNAERRRLGVYQVGYQILREDKTPLADVNWTISFARFPEQEAVKFVYAAGSKSGATGETIFNYIASNRVSGDEFREEFFDASSLEAGNYVLRIFAADFFGNTVSEDINFMR